jgi:hypothetical protein
MDKRDPLIEQATNILNSLQVYKNNITMLNEEINDQEKDKKILEESIDMMENELMKKKALMEDLHSKRERIFAFIKNIEEYKSKISSEYNNLLNSIKNEGSVFK